MNKLDLIFQKQPPEVQRKLMNLLIQYNAMMQYNAKEDNFQVDLLLPFKTQQQKKQFIENFKSRSSKKSGDRDPKSRESVHRDVYHSENIRPKLLQVEHKDGPQYGHHSEQNSVRKASNQHENFPERQDQPQISYELTNQNYQPSQRRKTLSIRDVSSIIKDKLRQAISLIKYQNQHGKSPDSEFYESSGRNNYHENDQDHDSIRLNKVEMEEQGDGMILPGLGQAEVDSTHKKWRQKQDDKSKKHSGENSEDHSRGFNSSSHRDQNQILIDDQNQNYGQQDHPQTTPERQQVPVIPPITGNVFKNYLEHSRQELKKQKPQPQKQPEPEHIRNMKQKLSQKYGTKKPNSTNIRHKYSQFLKKNHRDFDRIYQTIRKQIKRNQNQLNKSRRQNPILILEENLTDTYSEQDRIFKEEIIKDYQKHIIAQNQNMSSEDLIRYFRYLLQNAKNIYVKNLRKGKV